MSRDALLLCVHIFFQAPPPSLSSSLHLSLHLLSPTLFPLVICFFLSCGIWGAIHWGRIVPPLIHSRGWAPRGGLGDCGCSCLPSPPPAPRHPAPLLLANTMMSWLSFSLGWRGAGPFIDSLSLLHTLYISLYLVPPPNLCRSFSQILLLLKRRRGDLGMFGCCSAQPRKMPRHPEREPHTPNCI